MEVWGLAWWIEVIKNISIVVGIFISIVSILIAIGKFPLEIKGKKIENESELLAMAKEAVSDRKELIEGFKIERDDLLKQSKEDRDKYDIDKKELKERIDHLEGIMNNIVSGEIIVTTRLKMGDPITILESSATFVDKSGNYQNFDNVKVVNNIDVKSDTKPMSDVNKSYKKRE